MELETVSQGSCLCYVQKAVLASRMADFWRIYSSRSSLPYSHQSRPPPPRPVSYSSPFSRSVPFTRPTSRPPRMHEYDRSIATCLLVCLMSSIILFSSKTLLYNNKRCARCTSNNQPKNCVETSLHHITHHLRVFEGVSSCFRWREEQHQTRWDFFCSTKLRGVWEDYELWFVLCSHVLLEQRGPPNCALGCE